MLRKTNPIKMMLIKTNLTHKQSQSQKQWENTAFGEIGYGRGSERSSENGSECVCVCV